MILFTILFNCDIDPHPIHTALPKRIMRDVRNRILAIEWIHFISILVYGILFALSISIFSFTLSNEIEGSPVRVKKSRYLKDYICSSIHYSEILNDFVVFYFI